MKAQPQFNMKKAAVYSVVINAFQILAMLALAIYVFTDEFNHVLQDSLGDILILMLTVVVIWGAVVDIREAVKTGRMHVQLHGLDETVTQMTDMNHALRAQRHDFLNHLQVVYSLMEMEEFSEAQQYISQVYGNIQDLSRQLKTACAPVNALLRAKTTEAEGKHIRLFVDVKAAWKDLPLPAWEMCRVLSNLIDNAMDALAGKKDAAITVTLKEDVRSFSFSVANNGPMIAAEAAEKIFEAGFSGKGEGRGMGLHICRKTLRQYEGDLSVSSTETETVFSGYVPKQNMINGGKPHDP
ncbi:MAG: Spo0B domain-containing protein [Clostridia bacterium]|nr:Spo0B domain-containing protein [Clostridia bacterium]